MTLTHILVFTLVALLVGRFVPVRSRTWTLLGLSILAIYWMEPSTPIRNLDFWLPTLAIGLTVLVWAITRHKNAGDLGLTLLGTSIILGMILLLGITRYLEPICCLTPTPPPQFPKLLLSLGLIAGVATTVYRIPPNNRALPVAAFALILALFLILKTESLAQITSAGLRLGAGQDASLASALDLRWLGFSYLAFRLLHALRDYQSGKLPAYSLGEFATYAIFFPAYTAGPIDRSQHFIQELRSPSPASAANTVAGGWRILWGVFKKFALADSLAFFALNAQNAAQTTSTLWTWVLLYAYALRIYFDFSGYTDIALGLARLLGITLPENFTAPYLKTNLTAFWNSWHITLAQWFRAYFFNPLTRALRTHPRQPPVWLVILLGQFGTMLLIGLWHGLTLNFAIWGLWHGAGLFIHNRWADWSRAHLPAYTAQPQVQRLLQIGGWFLTFNYVALSWVWFALPDVGASLHVFARLLGVG